MPMVDHRHYSFLWPKREQYERYVNLL